jgi:hypothetical protein
MADSPEYLIDEILPRHEVHLLGGPSGGNKTTFLHQQLKENWRPGGQILGYAVHPVPFIYISADRSKAGTARTLKRIGVDPEHLDLFSLTNKQTKTYRNYQLLLKFLHDNKPDAKMLFIDGFSGMVPARKDRNTDGGFSHISNFLVDLQGELEEADNTLMGLVHSPKMKEESRYTNPRERVMGSAAWAAHVETILMIEPTSFDRASVGKRTIILCPRNAAEQYFDYVLNASGLLVPAEKQLTEDIGFARYVAAMPVGEKFSTGVMVETLMQGENIVRSTAYAWIASWESAGYIQKCSHGWWVRTDPAKKDPAN